MSPNHPARRFHITGRPGPCDRPPLPAGHPVTWGAITQGTVLDCATYPFPVFEQTSQEIGQ